MEGSLHDVAKALVSQMAAQASLYNSLSIAKNKFDRYQVEYASMERQFQQFPPMRERLTKRRDEATNEVVNLERQLKEHEATHESLAATLEHAILNVPNRAQIAPNSELVSRENFEFLQRSHETLQNRFDQQQEKFEKQQSQCHKQQADIEDLRKLLTHGVADSTKFRDESLQKLQHVDKRTAALEERSAANEKSIKQAKDTSNVFATQLNDTVNSKFDVFATTVSTSKADNKAGIEALAQGLKEATCKLTEGLSKNKTDLAGLETTINRLYQRVGDTDASMTAQIVVCENEIKKIYSEIREPGKDSAVTRLKRQDQLLNNTWTKAEKISQLEKVVDDLQKEFRTIQEKQNNRQDATAAIRTSLQIASPNSTFASREFVEEQLRILKESIDEDSDMRDTTVADRVMSESESSKNGLKELSNRLEELGQNLSHESNQLSKKATDAQTWAHAQITTIEMTLEKMQSQLDLLSGTVQSLQKRPSPAITVPPADTPQFRPVSLPGTPTGVTGQPGHRGSMTGPGPGPGRPDGTALQPSRGAISPVGPSSQELARMQNSINSLAAQYQNLKYRFDNLTTEESARMMVDQMSRMYPAPKDFQASVHILQDLNNAVDNKVNSINDSMISLRVDLDQFRSDVSTDNDRSQVLALQSSVQGLENTIRTLQDDLEGKTKAAIESARGEVAKDISAQTDSIMKLNDRFKILQDRVTEVQGNVSALESVAFS